MKKFMLIILVFGLLFFTGCAYTVQDNIDDKCREMGGNWLSSHNECEFISAQDCSDLNGSSYVECASACRHMPPSTVCTQQCVPVCSFNN